MNPENRILGNQRGMALLLTLSLIAILLAVSLELNRRVRVSLLASEAGKTDHDLMEMAESGIILAQALLVKDAFETQIDSVQEEWADPAALDQIIASLAWEGGTLQVKIRDEMGKIQVNALVNEYPGHGVNGEQRQIWETLLSFFIGSDKSEDKRDPQEIINCLIDWLDDLDDDMITGISGAETDYYESLDPPYPCANRPFSDLNELFLVKGITPDLLVKAESLGQMFLDTEGDEQAFQLEDLLTVFGATPKTRENTQKKYSFSGKININTAPLPVVAALLPLGRQDLAQAICEYRLQKIEEESGFTNDLTAKGWYADIAGLSPEEKTEMEKKITYASSVFSIESHARQNTRSLKLKSVVIRKKDKNGRWVCNPLTRQREWGK